MPPRAVRRESLVRRAARCAAVAVSLACALVACRTSRKGSPPDTRTPAPLLVWTTTEG